MPDYISYKSRPDNSGGLSLQNSKRLIYELLDNQSVENKSINLVDHDENPIDLYNDKNEKQNTLDYESHVSNILRNIDNRDSCNIEEMNDVTAEGNVSLKYNFKNIEFEEIIDEEIIDKMQNMFKLQDQNIRTGYYVEICNSLSFAEAEQKWEKLHDLYPQLFANMNYKISKKEIDRYNIKIAVIVGPYSDWQKVFKICKVLSKRNYSCVIKSY